MLLPAQKFSVASTADIWSCCWTLCGHDLLAFHSNSWNSLVTASSLPCPSWDHEGTFASLQAAYRDLGNSIWDPLWLNTQWLESPVFGNKHDGEDASGRSKGAGCVLQNSYPLVNSPLSFSSFINIFPMGCLKCDSILKVHWIKISSGCKTRDMSLHFLTFLIIWWPF